MSNYFKTKPINIDEIIDENQIKSIKNFDEKLNSLTIELKL